MPDFRASGLGYRKTGKFKEAAVVYRQLLINSPDNENYIRSLAFCLEKGGKRKTAILLIEKAVRFIKPSTMLLLIYGILLSRESEYEKALSQFRKVIDLDKKEWRAYENISLIYRNQGVSECKKNSGNS